MCQSLKQLRSKKKDCKDMDQNTAFIYAKTEIGEYGMDKWQ